MHQKPKTCVYDIETFFEALSIASNFDKEILFVGSLFDSMRKNPDLDITTFSHEFIVEQAVTKIEKCV